MKELMNNRPTPDWDPTSPEVQRDQRAAYDEMRRRCPVAYSEFLGWSLFRHEDVTRVLLDHETFSSAASRHLSVPSGMDQPAHTAYRGIIEPYFSAKRLDVFEPECRRIAAGLVQQLTSRESTEFMDGAALPFAARTQCAFLGWPSILEGTLIDWTHRNHEATLKQDRRAMAEIALEFELIVGDLLDSRIRQNAGPETDLTASLMHEKICGRPLRNPELASILRNWTVGEIGTISAAVGILTHYLATYPVLQRQLRANPELLPPAIEEILRIDGPLVANRRITTRPVEIGGKRINADERITLMWMAANRDERAFEEPESFRLDRDPRKNLLWGAGIHVCPGAPLARLEMRVFMEELLSQTARMTIDPKKTAKLAIYPASGFERLPLEMKAKTILMPV